MIRNYTFGKDCISIITGGQYVDLHNFYHIEIFQYEAERKYAQLQFAFSSKYKSFIMQPRQLAKKRQGLNPKQPPITFPAKILFEFRDIDYCLTSETVKNITGLESIGFKEDNDFNHGSLMLPDQEMDQKDHLFFSFYPDDFLRIHAKESKVTIVQMNL